MLAKNILVAPAACRHKSPLNRFEVLPPRPSEQTLSDALSETNAAVPHNKKAAQKCGSLQIPIWWRRGELDSLHPLIVR